MAPARLIELAPDALYVPGAVNVGVIRNAAGEALLVDTGGDKEYGRSLRKLLEGAGLRPVAILNTHSHADHYGGNEYLARNLSLPVWAPELEEAVLHYPYLEPMYLFGGAAPLAGLRNKWLEAKSSPVDHIYEVVDGPLVVGPFEVMRHVTSGHAMRQVAVGVGAVCYAADAFFGAEVLAKYEIPFVHEVGGQLDSLERLLSLPYDIFLPGHGEPTRDIAFAVASNRAAIERTAEWVRGAVTGGATTSEVVHRVTSRLAAPPSTLSTYFLMHACILAYLTYLTSLGDLAPVVEAGALRWVKTP
ncbi:MAG: MBL fold metallo-hydrolase [Ardenticatenales bacterium]|nr:MBL fold metallo-hydrolase [Ardenticatenales bacterium]